MNGTSGIRSIGFRDDRSPYWPHLNAHGRGDISLGRQIASPLDSIRSPPPLPFSPISSRVFPITGTRVSSLYRDRRQPPLRLSGPQLPQLPAWLHVYVTRVFGMCVRVNAKTQFEHGRNHMIAVVVDVVVVVDDDDDDGVLYTASRPRCHYNRLISSSG